MFTTVASPNHEFAAKQTKWSVSLCIELCLPPLVYLEVIHHIRQHFLICCIFAVPRIKTNKNVAFSYHVRILFVCNYAK